MSMHVSGNNNRNVGDKTTYKGLSVDDLIKMIEERFQHMLKKENQIDGIFEENRKLTEGILKQNDFLMAENKKLSDQAIWMDERVKFLTDKLIER